ncbi:MAG: cysteine desulfurase [Lachnospiraceae bacterium]|nr:cysteine desulfurase [Lachnospiraceae bacterium]
MKEIYLDNSATTKAFPEVIDLISRVMEEDYGNPSSMHHMGVVAEGRLKESTNILSGILGCTEKNIFYTSGGTESDNIAILGAAKALERRGKHIITTKIEHPAVMNTVKHLEDEGFEVSYLGTGANGRISLDELSESLTEGTVLVSIMHTNNEIGSLQPIEEAGKLIKEKCPECLFHVDAVQGFGKARITPSRMKIDLLSASSHKIHGPKGCGLLYIGDGVRIVSPVYGGGQQRGIRSGTENVPGISGMALAAKMLYEKLDVDTAKLYELKKYFIENALKTDGISINGLTAEGPAGAEGTAPHIISVSVKDVRAEVLLHSLEDKGIYVSAGSACSTHKRTPSATLTSIGLDKGLLESTVRISMSVLTTREEIDETLKALSEIVPMLRRFTRK